MDNKIINFHIYRYHLLPIDNTIKQLEIFPKKTFTYEEIRENKNKFFSEVLDKFVTSTNNSHPLKLENKEESFYLFKIAQKKTTTITKNFKNELIDNEPYVYVIINNDNNVQKIAISDNTDAFSNPDVIKNILKKVFKKNLEVYGLNIEIEKLFNSIDFWETVNKYKSKITYINFHYIKPNLANISSSLPEDFKDFTINVNSHESQISIKSPEKGALENISKQNSNINGLVNYAAKGGGNIKMKVKSIRKQLNTNENPTIIEIRELDIEGAVEQVIKVYKSIVME